MLIELLAERAIREVIEMCRAEKCAEIVAGDDLIARTLSYIVSTANETDLQHFSLKVFSSLSGIIVSTAHYLLCISRQS